MTPSITEILNAVRNDPEVRDALRRELLSQDLLELPERFSAHAAATERRLGSLENVLAEFIAATNRRLEALEQGQEELKQDMAGLKQGQEELKQGHDSLVTIVTGVREDIRPLKAAHARNAAERAIVGIALTNDCLPVKQLGELDLYQMLPANQSSDIDRASQESFRRADLVIEAEHESTGETHYFAVEASYTAGLNDIRRAVRNAEYLTRFTGRSAQPVVASVDIIPEAEAAFREQGCTHYAIPRRHLETD